MRSSIRLAALTLAATVALVLACGTATAGRSIQLTGGPGLSAAGQIPVFSFEELANKITCDVTLLATVGQAIAKVVGTQFGRVTGIAIDRGTTMVHCNPSSFETLEITPLQDNEAPGVHRELGAGVLAWDLSRAAGTLWALIYDSFQGTLPSISGLNFHIPGFQYLVRWPLGMECLFLGTVYGLASIEGGSMSRMSLVLERTSLNKVRGTSFCAARTFMSGRLTLSPSITTRLL